MIGLTITAPDLPDRAISLAEGDHTIGADPACDVFLMDEGIAPRHFRVEVQADGVTLTLLQAAHAIIDGQEMPEGAAIPVRSNMTIEVGVVQFVISGDLFDRDGPSDQTKGASSDVFDVVPHPQPPRRVWRSATGFGVCVVAVAVLAVTGFVFVKSSARATTENAVVDPQNEAVPLNTATVAPKFLSDFAPDGATATPSGDERPDVSPAERAAKQLMASRMVLEGIDRSLRAISVTDGVLTVEGLRSDDANAPDIRRALLADVSGLTDVRFDVRSEDRIAALRDQVAGVWAGERPYVVRTDGTVIKPRQELFEGAILVAVQADAIEIAINSEHHRVELQ